MEKNLEPVRIKVAHNGPLMVEGDFLIEDAHGKPIPHAVKVALCRCGHSKNKPFCDGAHIKSGFNDAT